MDWLKTGLRETPRLARRLALRLRRWRLGRRLRRAETWLGELGWEQADFPPEVEAEVRRIRDVEYDQAQLQNVSAALAGRIQSIRDAADEATRLAEEEIARLENEKAPHVSQLEAEEKRIAEGRAELTRCETILSKNSERRDILRAQDIAAAQIREARVPAETARVHVAEIDARLADRRERMHEKQKAARREIHVLESEKNRSTKGLRTLDRTKAAHYLLVGKCLADARIAPMNQPEALDMALALRDRIGQDEARIAELLAATRAEDPKELWTFYAVVAIAAMVVLTAIAVFASR